MQQLFD